MRRPELFLGIDPGLSGAFAFWRPGDQMLEIRDMPTLKSKPGSERRVLDVIELARWLDVEVVQKPHVTLAVLEQAGPRPHDGTRQAFGTGCNWGAVYGVVCSNFIRCEIVPPHMWKRAMSCPKAKDGAIARAKQLLPQHAGLWTLKKHDGRAEAALMALYAEQRAKALAP